MHDPSVLAWGLGVVGSLTVAGIIGGVANAFRTHGRLSACEKETQFIEKATEEIKDRLDRIETKIDRFVERTAG